MGAVLSCTGGSKLPDAILNYDNPQASEDGEKQLCDAFQEQVVNIISEHDLLNRFKNCKDKSDLIAQTFANPGDEEKKRIAKEAVEPNVQLCQELMDLSETMSDHLKRMVDFVKGKAGQNSPLQVLERCSLLCKTISQAIDISLQLDAIKLTLFKISGDISFYRRCETDQVNSRTGFLGMFFGLPAPFITKLSEPWKSEQNKSFVVNFFGSLCDLLTANVLNNPPSNDDSKKLMVRSIGGVLIIIDALSPTGAFAAKAGFANVEAAEAIANAQPKPTDIIAAVAYNSTTFNNPTTLPEIATLLKP